jgi:hypothetical protein
MSLHRRLLLRIALSVTTSRAGPQIRVERALSAANRNAIRPIFL